MSCREYEKYGILALYGELSDSEREKMETHMSTCSICREMREKDLRLREHIRELGTLKAPDVDFEALYARAGIQKGNITQWLARIFFNPWRGLALASVVILLLVSFSVFLPVKKSEISRIDRVSDYTWQSSEDLSLEELQNTLGSMEGFGTSLYEINKRVERRCSDDIVCNIRAISSYEDEIAVMKKEIESF
ncbi:MAG: anti-sigma factor [Vulcanimicrobiota bacterium]